MPKIAKRFLIAAASVVAVIAVILLCINLYLQSGGVQQRIRAAAGKELGAEVKIGSTAYTPWGGLVLRGVTVPEPEKPERNVLEAIAIRVRFRLGPLLQQRFVVHECAIFEPKFVVHQSENGDWIIPLFAKRPAPTPTTVEAPQPPKAKGPSFRAAIERVRLGSGSISFIDAKGRSILLLEKVAIDARVAEDMAAEGTFEVGRLTLSGSLKPRKLSGPFTWNVRDLDAPDIRGTLAGGDIRGSYHLAGGAEPSFKLTLQLNGVMLKKLAEDAAIEPGRTQGTLQGDLALSGDPRSSNSLAGGGHFQLDDAKLRPWDFIVKLGELLQVEELQLLQLSAAKADFTVRDKRVILDDVLLKSENLILTGRGPIRFTGRMNIDAELMVNRKLQGQLKGLLGKGFVASDDPDYQKLPFEITGKISSPKTDLLDKLTGFNIGQDVGGLLQNIFKAVPSKPAPEEKAGN